MTEHNVHKESVVRPIRLLFCFIFMLVMLADQATKQIMLDLIFEPPRRIEILAILNLVPVWTRGLSFGMLADGGALVPIGLTGLAVAVVCMVVLDGAASTSRSAAGGSIYLLVEPLAMRLTGCVLARLLIL